MKITSGEWVAVPLKTASWAIGLVARASKDGVVLFGYFFGPPRNDMPDLADTRQLKPEDAILVGKFGYLGIKTGAWPVVGKSDDWLEEDWPLPWFVRRGSLDDRIEIIRYSEVELAQPTHTKRVREQDVVGLPEDGLMGDRFVAERLNRLLT